MNRGNKAHVYKKRIKISKNPYNNAQRVKISFILKKVWIHHTMKLNEKENKTIYIHYNRKDLDTS